MQQRRLIRGISITLAFSSAGLLFAAGACSGDNTTQPVTKAPSPSGNSQQPPAIAHVSLTPKSLRLSPGAMGQLAAAALDETGSVLTGKQVTWRSSDASVASVDSTGRVLARVAGTVKVFATIEGFSDSATVAVTGTSNANTTVSLVVSPRALNIFVGSIGQLSAVPLDANGAVVSGKRAVWQTSNASIATVDTAGRVLGKATGTAKIFGTIDGLTDSATVAVVGSSSIRAASKP